MYIREEENNFYLEDKSIRTSRIVEKKQIEEFYLLKTKSGNIYITNNDLKKYSKDEKPIISRLNKATNWKLINNSDFIFYDSITNKLKNLIGNELNVLNIYKFDFLHLVKTENNYYIYDELIILKNNGYSKEIRLKLKFIKEKKMDKTKDDKFFNILRFKRTNYKWNPEKYYELFNLVYDDINH